MAQEDWYYETKDQKADSSVYGSYYASWLRGHSFSG